MELTALRLQAAQLYVQGHSTEEVGRKMMISSSTVRRYLKHAGVPIRKKWSTDNGIRADGHKKCVKCDKWMDPSNYYKRKAGGLYSYCKPCDRERAAKDQKSKETLER